MDLEQAVPVPVRQVQRLRTVCILESVSFAVLLGMMFSHYEAGISIAGAIHGLLFLAYSGLVLLDREPLGWSWPFAAMALLTGPLGAIIVLEKLRRR